MICQHRKSKSQTDVGFPVNKVEMVLSISQCYCRVKCLYSFWKLIKWITSSLTPVNISKFIYLCNSDEFICYSLLFHKLERIFSSLIWNVSHTQTQHTQTHIYIYVWTLCVYTHIYIHAYILCMMLYILYIWRKGKRENKYHKLIPPKH